MNFTDKNEQDIVIGDAIIMRDHAKKCWAVPFGLYTEDENSAIRCAEKVDRIIQANKAVKV